MKKVLLASAGALALCAALSSTAVAGVSGTLSGSYANVTNSGGADIWNVDGSLADTFASNWGAEVTGGYHSLSSGGSNVDIWNIGGSVFWASMQGRLAATVNYDDLSISPVDFTLTSYGVSGEWFGGPNFTLALKGGGDTGTISCCGGSVSASGGYAGGMLEWYVMPNLALSGSVDYIGVSGGHETTEEVKLEWLFSQSMPVSIYGGYQHLDCGTGFLVCGGTADIVFGGLKLYMNGPNGGTLVDRQRSSGMGWAGRSPVFTDEY